jgi:hypothetical protein
MLCMTRNEEKNESASARAIIYITVTVQYIPGYQNNLYSVDCQKKAPLHVTGPLTRKESTLFSRFYRLVVYMLYSFSNTAKSFEDDLNERYER